jgi:hypothetical protein
MDVYVGSENDQIDAKQWDNTFTRWR